MIPWRRKWQPTPLFLLGKSHGQGSLVGYSPWGCKESDIPEWLSMYKRFANLMDAILEQRWERSHSMCSRKFEINRLHDGDVLKPRWHQQHLWLSQVQRYLGTEVSQQTCEMRIMGRRCNQSCWFIMFVPMTSQREERHRYSILKFYLEC